MNTEEGGRRRGRGEGVWEGGRGRGEGVGERELWSRGGWRGRIKVKGTLYQMYDILEKVFIQVGI